MHFECELEQRMRSLRMILNIKKKNLLRYSKKMAYRNAIENLYNEQFDFLPKCGETQFWLLFDYKMRLALRIASSCQKRSKRQMKSEANKPKAEETTNKTPTTIISSICFLLHNATVCMFGIAEISV